MLCPKCGNEVYPEMVDNGVGMQQVEPAYCSDCNWVEGGCPQDECCENKCISYYFCLGKSIGDNYLL
jgi:hypothetical protein